MSAKDTITLPREAVEKIHEAWSSEVYPPATSTEWYDIMAALRAYLAAPTVKESLTHPGYVIGSHWLETAYSRICAGEAEADVLRDCGWERVDDAEALRRDADRLWEALKHYGKHDDDCGDHDAYNSESLRHCGCGLDAVLDETLGEKR